MDGMIGGFHDRAEIAANLLYPFGIDGNCTKQEIFLEGATWAFNQFREALSECAELGDDVAVSEYWCTVIFGQLTRTATMDNLIVGNKAKED